MGVCALFDIIICNILTRALLRLAFEHGECLLLYPFVSFHRLLMQCATIRSRMRFLP